jgi:hypothetical protein
VLSPVEVRRIQGIIAAVYCGAPPADSKGMTAIRVMSSTPKGSTVTMPRTVEAQGALAPAYLQLPR